MSESEEKTLPPTTRKLRDARRRGELARSKDFVTAVVTVAGLFATAMLLPSAMDAFTRIAIDAGQSSEQPFMETVGQLLPHLGWASVGMVGPLLLLVAATVVLSGVAATGGLALSFTPILPKFDRIDPVKGFGRVLALRNLVELIKSAVKLMAILAITFVVLRSSLNEFAHLPACGVACIPGVTREAMLPLLAGCCIVFLLFGLLDLGLQRWLFRRDMRMTRTEHKRDQKESQGDPHLASHRKKERKEAAQLGARTGLKHATFLVQSADQVLAFRYARPDATVPILVARQRNEAVNRVLAEARQRNLPVVYDPEAVAAIGKRLEVGKMIPKTAFGPIIHCMKAIGVLG